MSGRTATRAWLLAMLACVAARAQEAERPVYFVRDITPIFSRQGCSAAPCHGKISGQGRLKLSLMTLAPTMDFEVLEPLVNLKNPEQSLLLLKPTHQVDHGGGRRFSTRSTEYQTILKWIEQGCRNPSREALPTRLFVKPERFVFEAEDDQGEITVSCEFADGSVENVTDRTRFIAQDEAIASVTPKGYVRGQRWGTTAIMCRYAGITKPVFISIPRPKQPEDDQIPLVKPRSLIDTLVFNNLKWLGLRPSQPCDDYAFLRRVSLDLVGALPEPEEIKQFVADQAPSKRDKAVDRLLDDPRFVDVRTLRLGDMLRVNPRKLANGPLQDRAAMVFDTWLRDTVRNNTPYDQVVYRLLTAEGSSMLDGPVNFYRVERSPQDRAETVAQAFLGVRLACARCHNHPFDRWTTDDYWEFSAFMAKVKERPGELYNEGVLYHDNNAKLNNDSVTSANKGKVAVPTLLGGSPVEPQPGLDYLQTLADWVVAPDNPYFAEATVNRVWSHLMGRGVIDPVDDMRVTSVSAVPALLKVLAGQFVKDGYNVKDLVREIVCSQTYQLASDVNSTNLLDQKFFSHYQPKQMLAQVLLDAINDACGTADGYGTFPLGTRATSLPLPIRNEFLDKFGRSDREFLASLDPHVEPTLPQTLMMINSPYINAKVAAPRGTVAQLLKQNLNDRQVIDELYLRTFCRPPTPAERDKLTAYIQEVGNRREALEDILWSLITSREFLFIA